MQVSYQPHVAEVSLGLMPAASRTFAAVMPGTWAALPYALQALDMPLTQAHLLQCSQHRGSWSSLCNHWLPVLPELERLLTFWCQIDTNAFLCP